MPGRFHTQAEADWAREIVEKYDGEVPSKKILDEKVVPVYIKKFGKQITGAGMYTWLRAIAHPELYGWKAVKARKIARQKDPNYTPRKYRKDPLHILQQSSYIVVIPAHVAMGVPQEGKIGRAHV
jgi:hypothetical protein